MMINYGYDTPNEEHYPDGRHHCSDCGRSIAESEYDCYDGSCSRCVANGDAATPLLTG